VQVVDPCPTFGFLHIHTTTYTTDPLHSYTTLYTHFIHIYFTRSHSSGSHTHTRSHSSLGLHPSGYTRCTFYTRVYIRTVTPVPVTLHTRCRLLFCVYTHTVGYVALHGCCRLLSFAVYTRCTHTHIALCTHMLPLLVVPYIQPLGWFSYTHTDCPTYLPLDYLPTPHLGWFLAHTDSSYTYRIGWIPHGFAGWITTLIPVPPPAVVPFPHTPYTGHLHTFLHRLHGLHIYMHTHGYAPHTHALWFTFWVVPFGFYPMPCPLYTLHAYGWFLDYITWVGLPFVHTHFTWFLVWLVGFLPWFRLHTVILPLVTTRIVALGLRLPRTPCR